MKHLRKALAALLCLTMLLTVTACSSSKPNTAPEIEGVFDQSVEAESEFNALEGVVAKDEEDGDITSKIVITSIPALEFKNGKATPSEAGNYELTYSVTDKGGETAEAYATLTVTKKTGEAVIWRQFDFTAPQSVDNHGWEASIAEGVQATGELKQGAYVFDITNPGNGDGDIRLVKAGVALKAADYRVKIWAKSTQNTYAHLIARDEGAEDWQTFGGVFNAVIGTEIAPVELTFTAPGEGSAEIMLNLGKITPNPDNPEDTTPENFTVTIDKIEIYEISGEEAQVPVYVCDFSEAGADAIAVQAGDGAAAAAAVNDGAGVITIDSYPTDGGVWSIKGDIGLGGSAVEDGQKYYYSFTLKADQAQAGECLVESATQNDSARVSFNSFAAAAGEEITVFGTFTADKAVADPVIRLQIGNPSDGVTSNVIYIDDVAFGKLEGDMETVKTIDAFNGIGDDIWSTYNGTDEDNERGVGAIWMENGTLSYRIDQGGTTDWHNKLICGTRENPLTLPSDSYFTVEITAKASKNVSCGFFLNPQGSWDPRISEGIDFTTQEQTFTFETTDTLIMDMDFEMLFQFGSAQTADLGEVTIEFSNITIWQKSVN